MPPNPRPGVLTVIRLLCGNGRQPSLQSAKIRADPAHFRRRRRRCCDLLRGLPARRPHRSLEDGGGGSPWEAVRLVAASRSRLTSSGLGARPFVTGGRPTVSTGIRRDRSIWNEPGTMISRARYRHPGRDGRMAVRVRDAPLLTAGSETGSRDGTGQASPHFLSPQNPVGRASRVGRSAPSKSTFSRLLHRVIHSHHEVGVAQLECVADPHPRLGQQRRQEPVTGSSGAGGGRRPLRRHRP